ncbi:hypothetical protein ROLI_004520 [Roseobacter fucihabitans]|uniref:Uncharacterized protein n=1 Tax=Roseobacter fucihabitans TaxID=1537242 RepID=A0ABZ2BPL2_9RHOB|nr:hypothetical protein [Roseobacter litoralis]MBC6964626.1 hypothetical protein [Roseobacter litoralis]
MNDKPGEGCHMQMKHPDTRRATIGDVMPNAVNMRIVVLLNDAYFGDRRGRSIREIKHMTGSRDLTKLKAEISLTEGEKVLPPSLAEYLLVEAAVLNIERDDNGQREHHIKDREYLCGDLLEPFDDPSCALTICPENNQWLIHTRDGAPWIYCFLPDGIAQAVLEKEPDLVEGIERSFPYS